MGPGAASFNGFGDLRHGLIGRHRGSGGMQISGTQPLIQHHLAVPAGGMHADGVCIGVETDQQKIDRSTAAEAVFHRLTEIEQSLMPRRCRQFVVAAVGSTALVGGIERTEVVGHHLQITGGFGRGIG